MQFDIYCFFGVVKFVYFCIYFYIELNLNDFWLNLVDYWFDFVKYLFFLNDIFNGLVEEVNYMLDQIKRCVKFQYGILLLLESVNI